MYQYLSGKLAEKTATAVVIDAGGIGYELHIPVSSFGGLPSLGENVRLYTHFVVREDAQLLYGFATEAERRLFRHLISISGIGPKTALTALSGVETGALRRAIIQGQSEVLRQIPGIGKKTAERMVIELREKLAAEGLQEDAAVSQPIFPSNRPMDDAIEALIALGYKKPNARLAVEKAAQSEAGRSATVEELVRQSLQHV